MEDKFPFLVGMSATAIVIFLGTLVGSIAGFFGGFVDGLLMRFTDFVLTFHSLVFVIVLNTILHGKVNGLWVLIGVIGLLTWGGVARIVRSKILAEKENDYILAAISIGCSPAKVIMKHLLPNVMSTIIVQSTLLFAALIIAETGLSYLGLRSTTADTELGEYACICERTRCVTREALDLDATSTCNYIYIPVD